MKLINNIFVSLLINKNIKDKIIKSGYGTPIKILDKHTSSGYLPKELVPRNISYTHIFIKEILCLTDKGNKIKIIETSINDNERCAYCSTSIEQITK